MCGICGFIYAGRPLSDGDHLVIRKMQEKLLHRGPDGQETLLLDHAALGFTRLSIIGIDNGMQPIYNEDESIVIVCNGEIFNYIELRRELRDRGHVFRTDSDIEVILHLYEEKGTAFLNELNGQFAFALLDIKKSLLFCARDQLGIIPFFYTSCNECFVFGSEIKAILEHPLVKAEVDLVGLDQIITFPGLISPRTMFKNIHSLDNGHFLLVGRDGKWVDREYWDLPHPGNNFEYGKSEKEYIDQLDQVFSNAVKLRLRSDVPSGFYLSGGLDSSMIAMKVRQLSSPGKKAFSIDFPDARISESAYQTMVADSCQADLYKKTFYFDDISERLPKAIYHCECPIKETYNTASLHLSEAVRDGGLKVILSGEGADEFFAGYVGYRFDKMRSLNLMGERPSLAAEEYALRHKIWGDGNFLYETGFAELEKIKKELYADGLRAAFDEINCLNHYVIDPGKLSGRDLLSKRSYIDYKLRLVDHLVSDHGDRMAMAHSVEVRYPFLDKDLVEFSTVVPPDLKLNEFNEKYLLRKLAEKSLPKEIAKREKFGFVAPGSPYLLQRNIEYINDLLSYSRIKRQGYFDADHIEKIKKQYSREGFLVNAPFEMDLLIIVITFGIFLDQFIDQS